MSKIKSKAITFVLTLALILLTGIFTPSEVNAIEDCGVPTIDPYICGNIAVSYNEEKGNYTIEYLINHNENYFKGDAVSALSSSRFFVEAESFRSLIFIDEVTYDPANDQGKTKSFEADLDILTANDGDPIYISLEYGRLRPLSNTLANDQIDGQNGPDDGDIVYMKDIVFNPSEGSDYKYYVTIVGGLAGDYTPRYYGLRVDGMDGSPLNSFPSEYKCNDFEFKEFSPLYDPEEITVKCDFSGLEPGETYNLHLMHFIRSGEAYQSVADSKSFRVEAAKIKRVLNIQEPIVGLGNQPTKKFKISIDYYSSLESGTHKLRIANKQGDQTYIECPFSPTTIFHTQECDFSKIQPGDYTLHLDIPSKASVDTATITIPRLLDETDSESGICSCQIEYCIEPTNPTYTAAEGPEITFDGCYLESTPKIASCIAATDVCICECEIPDEGITTPDQTTPDGSALDKFRPEDLTDWIKNAHIYLIAFGVIASLFIAPYAFILMATGNPENIKKGAEWLQSLAIGLLLLLLSGTVIRIIGTNLLGL